MVSSLTVCGINGNFKQSLYIHNLCIIRMFGNKNLLTNVTKTNKHLNDITFVRAL